MRRIFLLLLGLFIIIILVPFLLIKLGEREEPGQLLINVYLHNRDRIVVMDLEEYLRGVVAAEMPALYHQEALKAQAVAARTYTLRQLPAYGGKGVEAHPGADISTDYRICQAWLSEEEMKERWGFLPFFYYWARINRAVEETDGEVLLYQGKLIDAVYHANAGGITEDARNVWGRETPYLRSVKSPYDREREKNYQNTFYMGLDLLVERLVGSDSSVELKRDMPLEIIERSSSGRVLAVKLGERVFTGTEFREKLSLPSALFSVSCEGDILTFSTHGKGHGVGMSQDGADGYAKNGRDYREILAHYYPGTALHRLEELTPTVLAPTGLTDVNTN